MRPARPPKEIPPPLELECLKALWILREGNVRQVLEQIEPRKKLAYTTVMTLLDRLAKKGAVARRKSGRAFLYTPHLDRETVRQKAIQELTETLFEGSADSLKRYLLDGDRVKAATAAGSPEERLDTTLL